MGRPGGHHDYPGPASIPLARALGLTNLIQFVKRPAKRAILGEQEAMRPVLPVRRVGHGAKGVIFRVHLGGGHDIVAHVVGDVDSAMRCIHAPRLHHYRPRCNNNPPPPLKV